MSDSTPQVQYTYDPRHNSTGCLIQILWFIFIGWWLGLWAIAIAWLLNITIIGLPLGLWILNNIPMILALQQPTDRLTILSDTTRTSLQETSLPQINILLRAIYFLVIGWWWSLIWLLVAYLLSATIILLPVGLLMFRWTPFMTTLRRY
jgi:uncharacterized membrane protein YccF (DUF307 family)